MKKVLVVDDELNLREGLQKALVLSGFYVKIAENGIKALDICNNWCPDIIVTDIIMPELDGIGFILDVQKKCDCKIIAMSGGGRIRAEDHLGIAQKLGAYETLTKPFEFTELVRIINEAIKNE